MILLVGRKLGSLAVVLVVVSAVVYFLGRGVVPGDISSIFVGQQEISAQERAQVRHQLGLDRPIYVAYLDWARSALAGNLGTSPITGRTVSSELARQVPVSAELALFGLLLATSIGVPLGIVSAVRAGGRWDHVIRIGVLTMFGIPTFVTAIVLLLLAALYVKPLYVRDYVSLTTDPVQNLRALLLPAISIALPTAALTLQLTRTAMIEALGDPHIAMARAKGASLRSIHYIHALRNAAPAIVTLIAFLFGILLGGVVVVETVFNLPGIGRGMIEAVNQRDFQLLVPQTLVMATAFVVANTLAELAHPLLDPRLRQ